MAGVQLLLMPSLSGLTAVRVSGSAGYAFEELIADMSAAFVCSVLGIRPDLEHHASYLANWIRIIADDKQAFFRASHQAQVAANLLLENDGLLPEEPAT